MTKNNILDHLLQTLPDLRDFHAPDCKVYHFMKTVAALEIAVLFSEEEGARQSFPPFGDLLFPYTEMGAINSLDLFGLDELIIFSFYWANRGRYSRILDLGANIGLHSIILSKCGFQTTSFEPDPIHYALLGRNLDLNGVDSVKTVNAAISVNRGEMEFTRVLGNTTGSHLTGAKANVYGDIEKISTRIEPFNEVVKGYEFVKMDVEGHEKAILCATTARQWNDFDMMVEVGSRENARAIFDHFECIEVNLFAQKVGWRRVAQLEDMPVSHREGSLFITVKDEMPWE